MGKFWSWTYLIEKFTKKKNTMEHKKISKFACFQLENFEIWRFSIWKCSIDETYNW